MVQDTEVVEAGSSKETETYVNLNKNMLWLCDNEGEWFYFKLALSSLKNSPCWVADTHLACAWCNVFTRDAPIS